MSLEQIGGLLAIVGVIYTLWKDWPEIQRRLARPNKAQSYNTTYRYSFVRTEIKKNLFISAGIFALMGYGLGLTTPHDDQRVAAAGIMAVDFVVLEIFFIATVGRVFGG